MKLLKNSKFCIRNVEFGFFTLPTHQGHFWSVFEAKYCNSFFKVAYCRVTLYSFHSFRVFCFFLNMKLQLIFKNFSVCLLLTVVILLITERCISKLWENKRIFFQIINFFWLFYFYWVILGLFQNMKLQLILTKTNWLSSAFAVELFYLSITELPKLSTKSFEFANFQLFDTLVWFWSISEAKHYKFLMKEGHYIPDLGIIIWFEPSNLQKIVLEWHEATKIGNFCTFRQVLCQIKSHFLIRTFLSIIPSKSLLDNAISCCCTSLEFYSMKTLKNSLKLRWKIKNCKKIGFFIGFRGHSFESL